MNVSRVYSQVFKAILTIKKNYFRLFDLTVWPLTFFLSIVLFAQFASNDAKLVDFAVIAAIGWRVLYHFSFETTHLYVEEYWDDSADHLMFSPITLSDFVAAGAIVSTIKTLIVVAVFILASMFFLGRVPDLLASLPAMLFLAVFGMIVGIMFLGFDFALGNKVFVFNYATADVIAVFSGVFYPLSVFPTWIQGIAFLFPSAYGFSMIKNAYGITEFFDPVYAIIVLVVWFAVAIAINKIMLNKARKEGRLLKLK